MTMRRLAMLWLLLLASLASVAQAATVQAFLDRNHVSLGDTVTLNIQSTGPLGAPDLSSLQKDFDVLGTSSSRSVQIVNGRATSTEQLGIALKPRHAGTLTIPPIAVGGDETAPLTLEVGAAPSGGTGKVGDPVFMETNVQSSSPWVGQQTVYTVRLFYLPGVDGALSDPTADGARLIQLDRDHRYVTQRDGYTYEVIERSWALIPQRSGEISVRGPVFQGQRTGPGFPNAWFNNPNGLLNNPNALLNAPHGFGGMVHATAPVARVDARAPPTNAGKPWLPARSVELTLSGLPSNGEVDAGSPLTITLGIRASGQSADALPEPELPPIPGARVYPDQTRDSTDDGGKWLQGTRTRSFAIVPERNGKLTIPAITLNWWNVEKNRVDQAKLPAHTLQVSGVVAASSAPAAPPATVASPVAAAPAVAATASPSPTAVASPDFWWRDVALASIALWALLVLVGIVWWLSSRRRSSAAVPADGDDAGTNSPRSARPSYSTIANPQPRGAPEARVDRKALQNDALAAARAGDAASCERALLAWARASRSGIVSMAALQDALSDPAQRAALGALQRARWQGSDRAIACAGVLRAFEHGFKWRGEDK
ncbi:MAG TPA: BatD family protein, partial [Rhodanobacteraceae bacterium]|nr:BatD family protein [Rhodanobacteraceae bacterium]